MNAEVGQTIGDIGKALRELERIASYLSCQVVDLSERLDGWTELCYDPRLERAAEEYSYLAEKALQIDGLSIETAVEAAIETHASFVQEALSAAYPLPEIRKEVALPESVGD